MSGFLPVDRDAKKARNPFPSPREVWVGCPTMIIIIGNSGSGKFPAPLEV